MIPSPVALGRLQAGLRALVLSFLPSGSAVAWAHQAKPRDASSAVYVVLRMRGLPELVGGADGRRILDTPDEVTISVDASAAPRRVLVEANDVAVHADVSGSDADADRDALLEALEAAAEDAGITATASGSDEITIEPVEPGGLYRLRVAGSITATVGALTRREYVEGSRRMIVEVQAHVRRTDGEALSPRNGAADVVARILGGLELSASVRTAAELGIAYGRPSPPVDLTGLSGGEIESRGVFDLEVFAQSVAWGPADVVEAAAFSVDFLDPSATLTGEAAAP